MSITISGSTSLALDFNHKKTAVADTVSYTGKIGRSYGNSYTSTDITKAYQDNRGSPTPIASSESLDLTSLASPGFAASQSFSTVKIILIKNTSTTAISIGGGTNGFIANALSLPAGGVYYHEFSQTVDGTHKIIASSGTAYTYEITILGA